MALFYFRRVVVLVALLTSISSATRAMPKGKCASEVEKAAPLALDLVEFHRLTTFYFMDGGPYEILFRAKRRGKLAKLDDSNAFKGEEDPGKLGNIMAEDGRLWIRTTQDSPWVEVAVETGRSETIINVGATWELPQYRITRPDLLAVGIYKNDPGYGKVFVRFPK